MNYIPFPRIDLDKDTDLDQWRNNKTKREGDWTTLKGFLAKQARVDNAIHPIPKCWYSELPQGDNYALDIEHFRPKREGLPLSKVQIRQIEKLAKTTIYQHSKECNYPWLTFDYRNYRLVTALTNRAGGKHIYFPIASQSEHLLPNEFPWIKTEFPLLLDPTNRNDTSLLYVLPNGQIAPITPCTPLSEEAQKNPAQHWQSDGFKYIRAIITIFLYRLNEPIFIQGRKEIYDKMNEELQLLSLIYNENPRSEAIPRLIKNISLMLLPSAPFSLAAKSSLRAFIPNSPPIEVLIRKIMQQVEHRVELLTIDWNNP